MHDADIDNQLELATQAAHDVPAARKDVNTLIAPVINYQTGRFCKRFCRENRYRYQCSLVPPWGSPPPDASLCEWGNASYGWMLNELASSRRLSAYTGDNGSSLYNYLYQVANSLPFYERWKDWRFGRKVHVPTYIQALGPNAAKVFLALRAKQSIRSIASASNATAVETEQLCQRIISELTKRQRLYLLNPAEMVSLTQHSDAEAGDASNIEHEIASVDEPIEQLENRQRLQAAWTQLSAVEQFVIEALVIEEQDAQAVLAALKKLDISIKPGVAAEDTDRQQLYYFRRKTLAKIAGLIEAHDEALNESRVETNNE